MNDLGSYLFCHRCAVPLKDGPRGRRQARVSVTGKPGLFGPQVEHEHYELVTMCMPCWQGEEDAERTWQRKKLWLLGTTGVGLFSWVYFGAIGLGVVCGVVVLVLVGRLFIRRRRQQATYLPPDKGGMPREEKQ